MRNRSSKRGGGGAASPARHRAADRPRREAHAGPLDPAAVDAVQVVRRRCTICDWEAQLVERGAGEDPLCPWCYGATERTEIVGLVIPEKRGEKDTLAATLGRRGGLKGGPARAQKLSARRRREIASKAAKARWAKKKKT
jgi:hypothetical protein